MLSSAEMDLRFSFFLFFFIPRFVFILPLAVDNNHGFTI